MILTLIMAGAETVQAAGPGMDWMAILAGIRDIASMKSPNSLPPYIKYQPPSDNKGCR